MNKRDRCVVCWRRNLRLSLKASIAIMKFSVAIIVAIVISNVVQCQLSTSFNMTCAWMAGSKVTNQVAVYGTPGIASPTIGPGGRFQSCVASRASTPNFFYMFSGTLNIPIGDFWAFDVSTAYWTTIHGDKSQRLGTKGTPSPTNFPGGRESSTCAFSRLDDRLLWLFGGFTRLEGK